MRKAAQKPQPQEQESSEEESGSEQGEEKAYVVEAIKASRFDTLAGHWRWVVACPTICLGRFAEFDHSLAKLPDQMGGLRRSRHDLGTCSSTRSSRLQALLRVETDFSYSHRVESQLSWPSRSLRSRTEAKGEGKQDLTVGSTESYQIC